MGIKGIDGWVLPETGFGKKSLAASGLHNRLGNSLTKAALRGWNTGRTLCSRTAYHTRKITCDN